MQEYAERNFCLENKLCASCVNDLEIKRIFHDAARKRELRWRLEVLAPYWLGFKTTSKVFYGNEKAQGLGCTNVWLVFARASAFCSAV